MKEKNDSFENFLLFPNVQYITANEADISSSLKKNVLPRFKTFICGIKTYFSTKNKKIKKSSNHI
jgi:hypothetical protein